jgi:hypothetical protein
MIEGHLPLAGHDAWNAQVVQPAYFRPLAAVCSGLPQLLLPVKERIYRYHHL